MIVREDGDSYMKPAHKRTTHLLILYEMSELYLVTTSYLVKSQNGVDIKLITRITLTHANQRTNHYKQEFTAQIKLRLGQIIKIIM